MRIGEQTIDAQASEGLNGATGAVIVAIRPGGDSPRRQRCRLPAHNHLRGTIVESAFLGNIVDHQIDIGGGALVRVQGDRWQTYAPGAAVRLIDSPVAECVAMRSDSDG